MAKPDPAHYNFCHGHDEDRNFSYAVTLLVAVITIILNV